MNFKTFVDFLTTNGYRVEVKTVQGDQSPYKFAIVTGRNIHGGFCEPNDDSYSYLNGEFCADNVGCFDKWSKCPITLPFPQGEFEENQLLEMLNHLGSENGLEHSDKYEYLRANCYQYAVLAA